MFYPALIDYIKDANIAYVDEIFKEIQTESEVIFEDYDAELFEELAYSFYYANYKKPLKVLYYHKFVELDVSVVTNVQNIFKHIGKVAYSRFGDNWKKIYQAYFVDAYNPLENYDMTQTRTPLLDTTLTTTRKQETKTETSGSTSIVPFNDSQPTLTGESSGDSTTTEDKTKNEIESTNQERGTDTLTRHGNIGVTTSQQMLQSELDLRKMDFINRVFKDIETIVFRDFWPC